MGYVKGIADEKVDLKITYSLMSCFGASRRRVTELGIWGAENCVLWWLNHDLTEDLPRALLGSSLSYDHYALL